MSLCYPVCKSPCSPLFKALGRSSIAGGPCTDNLVAWWKDRWSDDGTQLLDLSTTATHEAMQGQSLLFSGAQHGTLASTVTLTGDFIITINGTIPLTSGDYMIISDGAANTNYVYIRSDGDITIKINNVADTSSGVNIPFDGSVFKLILTRVGTTLTYDFNGTTSIDTVDAGDFVFTEISRSTSLKYSGGLWDIKAEDSEVRFYNYLANGSGNVATSVIGPDVTLTGFTMDDDWISSALYGSTKHNELGYSVGVTDGVELWSDSPNLNSATNNGDGSFTITSNFGSIVDIGTLTFGFPYSITFTISGYVSGNAGISAVTTSDSSRFPNSNGTFTVNVLHDGTQSGNMAFESSVSGVTFSDISVQYAPQGYIPASLTNPTQDIYGNALTYSGRAAQPLDVFGYTVGWDGATGATLDSAITSSGDFKIDTLFNVSSLAASITLFGGATLTEGFLYISGTSGAVSFRLDGIVYPFPTITASVGVLYNLVFVRSGAGITATLINKNDGSSITETVAIPVAPFVIRYIASFAGTTALFEGTIPSIKLYNASNTLTNHWVIESGSQLNQGIIYDVVSGNHATLSGHTTPAFDTLFQPSVLAQIGGVEVENLLKYSEDLTHSSWNKTRVDATLDGEWSVLTKAEASQARVTQTTNNATGTSATVSLTIGESNHDEIVDILLWNSTTVGPVGNLQVSKAERDANPNGEFSFTVNSGITVGDSLTFYFYPTDTASTTIGEYCKVTKAQLSFSNGAYIKTTDTAIPLSIAPNGATDLPNSFNGIHDAPEDVFDVQISVASVEIEEADLTGFWINKTTGAANSVDPYDVEWIPDYQFSNETDILLYSTDVTGLCDKKTEAYMGLPAPGTTKIVDDDNVYFIGENGAYMITE